MYNGYHDYVVQTKFRQRSDFVEVCHRYSQLVELRRLLCLERPGCVVPPIPPKSGTAKLKNADSEEIELRRAGIEKFLQRLIGHQYLCHTEVLNAFLQKDDFTFEQNLDKV